MTTNGRCDGEVYEWCDYFSASLQRLDCAALGMTCRADPYQPPETDVNGCVGEPCDADDNACDGRLAYRCRSDGLYVMDCAQHGGEDAACVIGESGAPRCASREPCSPTSFSSCDGNLVRVCDEDGLLHFQDCARCEPQGLCVEGAGSANCDPAFLACENL